MTPCFEKMLTYGGRESYVLVNRVIIGSGNSLSPLRRQAITRTNLDLLLIRPPICFKENAFQNLVSKTSAIFLGLSVLAILEIHFTSMGWLQSQHG